VTTLHQGTTASHAPLASPSPFGTAEGILHAVKGNPKLQHREPDVLTGTDMQHSDHPTVKPPDLLARLIEATTASGQTVVDPFMGSGGTMLEAYRLGRDFFGIELEKQWYDPVVDTVLRMAEEEYARLHQDDPIAA